MKRFFLAVLFITLFGISLYATLLIDRHFSVKTLPTESVEELKLPPSAETGDDILPDHTINPSSINLLLNQEEQIIGGTSDGRWFRPNVLIPYLTGAEIYHIYSRSDWLNDSKGHLIHGSDNDHSTIQLQRPASSKQVFAILGAWDPFPRKPQYITDGLEKYYPLVKKVLKKLGVKTPVHICEIVRVDLEGDGTDELLITAENHENLKSGPENFNNLYSLIILCQQTDSSETVTIVLGGYHEPIRYQLLYAADINGDWNMEFLVRETNFISESSDPKIVHDILLKMENKEPVKVFEHRWKQ